MSSDSPLEIKVVYDSSGKRTGQRQTVAAKPVKIKSKSKKSEPETDAAPTVAEESLPGVDAAISIGETSTDTAISSPAAEPKVQRTQSNRRRVATNAAGTGRGLITLGLFSLLICAGLTYGIWWEIDKKFIGPRILTKTPIDDIDLTEVANLFGAAPPVEVKDSQAGTDPVELDEGPEPVFTGETARNIILGTAYGWETIATLSCAVLALAAGAGWGRRGGGRVRVLGMVLGVLMLGGLGWKGFEAWQEHGVGLPPDTIRIGVAGLIAVAAMLGIAFGRGTGRLYTLAAVGLFFAAIASVVALSLGNLAGAVEAKYLEPRWLGMVFMAHSLWAWMIMIFGRRMAK
ncbi:MAG: hypothetical protein ACPGXK_03260 [Phycisphaerae bacterium]